MSNIDDKTFARFIMNDMKSEELHAVESELLNNGEAYSILASSMSLWDITPNAIDMVGDVICKKSILEDRIENSEDSIMANEPNNATMVQLTLNDGKTIKKITEAFVASIDSSISLEENLKAFYLSQCPGTFPEEASEIISGIKEGVTSFDSALAQMMTAEDFEVDKIANQILEGKSLEEKYNILLNFLVALNTMQVENTKAEDGSYVKSFDQIKDGLYVAGVTVTEEMVAELNLKIKEALTKDSYTISSAEAVDELIHNLEKGEEDVKIFIANQEELFRQKMILSTAILIGARNNTLESLQGQEIAPQVIGAGVSAGLEQQKLMANLQAGNTTLDTVLKVLKYIGGAAILCAGLYFGINAIAGISSVFAAWGMSVVGLSTAGCIASWLATALLVTWPLSSAYNDALFFLLHKAGQFYDWAISKLRGKSETDVSFVDWLKFKIEAGEIVQDNLDMEQTQTVLA